VVAAPVVVRNDYCRHFLDSGARPQNFIRDTGLGQRFDEIPRLKELVQRKERLVEQRATPAMALCCDLRTFDLGSLGTRFDVLYIDPPWEEYAMRRGSRWAASWSFDEIRALRVDQIAESPSFVFLWCGTGCDGLEKGRALLKKWGFRRCEDICWLKTNHSRPAGDQQQQQQEQDPTGLVVHTKEHCIVGIRGTVRRSTDGHVIHANVDTDVVVSEEPPHGSTEKPEELYHIIEHFCLGRRRIELFGCDRNVRRGWVTLGDSLAASTWDPDAYRRAFVAEDGERDTLLGTTPEIEQLRPRSPPRPDTTATQATTTATPHQSRQHRHHLTTPSLLHMPRRW
jgi:mRNA (2'-O-methyladenosine-N6-)-methyltransferase